MIFDSGRGIREQSAAAMSSVGRLLVFIYAPLKKDIPKSHGAAITRLG